MRYVKIEGLSGSGWMICTWLVSRDQHVVDLLIAAQSLDARESRAKDHRCAGGRQIDLDTGTGLAEDHPGLAVHDGDAHRAVEAQKLLENLFEARPIVDGLDGGRHLDGRSPTQRAFVAGALAGAADAAGMKSSSFAAHDEKSGSE